MIEIIKVDDVRNNEHRAVCWLVSALPDKEQAHVCFGKLKEKNRTVVLKAIKYWLGGFDNVKTKHHGWNQTEHSGKFMSMHVFKNKKVHFYGVKSNPCKSNHRLQVCAIVGFFNKTEWDAPTSIMSKFLEIGSTKESIQAIAKYFP